MGVGVRVRRGSITPMRKALIVVDMQQGFTAAPALDDAIARHVRDNVGTYSLLVVCRFINDLDSLYRRVLGWTEMGPGDAGVAMTPAVSAAVTAVSAQIPVVLSERCSYNAVPEIADVLNDQAISEIAVCGVETDQCVLSTVLGAFDAGLPVTVLEELCGTSASEDDSRAALRAMRRAVSPTR